MFKKKINGNTYIRKWNRILVMTTDQPNESPHRLPSTHPKGLTGVWTECSHFKAITPSVMVPSDEDLGK